MTVPGIDFEGSAEDISKVDISLSPLKDTPIATTEPVEIPHVADVKEKTEAPQGEEKLIVQETAPVRRSRSL